ncbi:Hypothetical protein PP7435_CHR3-1163 [Komagataella phaffii CBS 7435]|uniref:RING-14 protein n=2 Tax=Komagataella phaffii TaxID=460519 RepID=C4R3H1_KOMPG|nr:uncharacterized protein PAS_chr3_1152 [Komagataella phaffii GS115]AOA63498.1 GQ67_03089T0 [Komagataella phaffii]CAH2450274.1 Hypothetical protein BQ9382_C3-6140 [Komagataella phaffii CBS 7435]AOA68930.1 GQ68_03073T0 [Komagataella phaffii GS115]CAY70006.1 hypothetical protein PAS_chr3_1152 [Komagataella phaffii GS115]CCA40105.1 Hypothetical protein PP7435_CHR3-1163 [Komagataella phaffii CBS 7435]
MKFAKLYDEMLKSEEIPEDWIGSRIQYKSLKKCINRVVKELESACLEKDLIEVLLEGDHRLADYVLEKDSKIITPKLIIRVPHDKQGLPKSETSSRLWEFVNNREYLKDDELFKVVEVKEEEEATCLVFHFHEDSSFFRELSLELEGLNNFKEAQKRYLVDQVDMISKSVSESTSFVKRRSDLYTWRELFKLYIDSEIFFKSSTSTAGERSVQQAKANLAAFWNHVNNKKFHKAFHQKGSRSAFKSFIGLNERLLKVSQFQYLNKMAMTKILKKFDKQTSLHTRLIFPKLLAHNTFIEESFAQQLCYKISTNLLSIIPQLDDYTCPICCSVAFKPIKLDCGHIFCVRCLVKLQRSGEDRCPLCRGEVVLNADNSNLDVEHMEYLQKYFPKEVKIKQNETEREIAKERFEAVYGEKNCIIM